MSMDLAAYRSWLDDYGRASESRDPRAAAELFTEAGTYQVTPFLKPMCGRRAIFEYWEHVARTEKDIRFGYEILAVTTEVGIARWWATLVIVSPGLQTKLDGIFLICLDVDRRCKSLQEWWHKQQD